MANGSGNTRICVFIWLPALTFVTWMAAAGAAESNRMAYTVDERGWLQDAHRSEPILISGDAWPADIRVDDTWFMSQEQNVSISRATLETGELVVSYTLDDTGTLTWRHTPFPALGEYAWLRTLTYENTTEATQDVTNARMYVRPSTSTIRQTWNPSPFYMARCGDNAIVAVAYKGTTDRYYPSTRNDDIGHTIQACWRLAPGASALIEAQGVWVREFDNGVTLDGRAWNEAFREEARRWYEAIGLRVPPGMPDWAQEMILYEYSGGGHIDSRFSDTGGFQRLAKQTDYLAALGISAVWLQAIHKHKTPPNPVAGGWNLYGPRDVMKVDDILGGEEALLMLCDGLHDAGIHILGETVPHGGHSVQAKALPEWWSYERDGTARRNWGGCGMDYASPEWQRILAESMAWQARTFGFAGCRIDVADGSGPNWNSPRTNHASYSTLGGAIELLEALHEAMSAYTPYPILIPEAFDQVEYFAITPVGYGHDFWMFVANQVQPLANDPTAMAATLRDYLERERGALPHGALTLRTLNNHDTVCEAGRVHQRFGVGLARALHGVCLMIPGIPMLYQEQEIGDWFALRDMHWARRSIPEFIADSVDYHGVTFAPGVFTCLRGDAEEGYALGMSNLSGIPVTDTVRFSEWISLDDGTVVYDGVSGNTARISDNSFPWTLAPYETALMRVGNAPRTLNIPAYSPDTTDNATLAADSACPFPILDEGELLLDWGAMRVRMEAGASGWRLGADDGEGQTYVNDHAELRIRPADTGLRCVFHFTATANHDWPELVVEGAHTWQVSARTAVLHDYVLRRHYPWPDDTDYVWDSSMYWGPVPGHKLYQKKSPTGRLWESVIEPLHPAAPGVQFRDAADRRVTLHGIKTNVKNMLLYDQADESTHVLRLAFRGHDTTLAPHVAAAGMGNPYILQSPPPDDNRVYEVGFVITTATENTELDAQIVDAPRLPTDRAGYRMRVYGENSQHNHQLGAVLPQPGRVVWTDLRFPDGRHRIQFTMRHSESSPEGTDLDDAYTIAINGEPLSYEWRERAVFRHNNAFFGHAVTPSLDLGNHNSEIAITTQVPWCMVKEQFVLIPVD